MRSLVYFGDPDNAPADAKFVAFNMEISDPPAGFRFSTEEKKALIPKFEQMIANLNEKESDWQFSMQPPPDQIPAIEDDLLRQAWEAVYVQLRLNEEDESNYLHDVGAKGRREALAALKPSVYCLGRRHS